MITIKFGKSKKLNRNDISLFITFPYDEYVVNVIRNLQERYWLADIKTWEVSANEFAYLLDKFNGYSINVQADKLFDVSPKEYTRLTSFEYKTEPFEHQVVGFNYGMEHDKWLLGDEQGLGKTKQVIDIAVAKKQERDYKHCLIICGVNGLKWNWQNEIKTHSNEEGYILGQRTMRNGKLKIGSTADKVADLKELPGAYFLITNVESFRDDELCKLVKDLCKKGIINMIAFDECHKAKNPTSQQGKNILTLGAETMIGMTGTPLMNTPLDLYFILKWLGYETHSNYSFKNHYAVMGGYGGHELMGYKNLDELRDRLDKIMLRRLKDDVLDLPEKTHIDEYVEMTGKQEQVYKEVTAEIKANIDQIAIAPNPLAQLIRMRQATGYTGILSSTIQESAKLDRMEELVEESVVNGKKVVIFSNWTQMTDAVYERLAKKYNVAQITGETADNVRQGIVSDYQNGGIDVLIGTIGAMGTGLTLTAGTVEIFMDEPWNRANKDQAEDRCHRIGAKGNVTIYTLICKNTIDERIHELVYEKGKMSDMLVDGKAVGNKRDTLEYLLG